MTGSRETSYTEWSCSASKTTVVDETHGAWPQQYMWALKECYNNSSSTVHAHRVQQQCALYMDG